MALIITGRIIITILYLKKKRTFFNGEETAFNQFCINEVAQFIRVIKNEYFLEICTAINLGHYWDKTLRLATDWTVQCPNLGGVEILCIRPERPWKPTSLLYHAY
jgi:hypothetical protein